MDSLIDGNTGIMKMVILANTREIVTFANPGMTKIEHIWCQK
jgi:hypothetical protein